MARDIMAAIIPVFDLVKNKQIEKIRNRGYLIFWGNKNDKGIRIHR
jgi:hypothetical protein